MTKQKVQVYCDGGSRGNPGPAAIGFVVLSASGKTLHKHHQYIGKATNNVAEYQAVISAHKWLIDHKHKFSAVDFFLDSKLVVNQLNGEFKVKNPQLIDLYASIEQFKHSLPFTTTFSYVPRLQNTIADDLVNQALDLQLH